MGNALFGGGGVVETAGNRWSERYFGDPGAWNPAVTNMYGETEYVVKADKVSSTMRWVLRDLLHDKDAAYKWARIAVLHFRCSDTPFGRDGSGSIDTHLPRFSYVRDIAAPAIMKYGNQTNRVSMMLCTSHDMHNLPRERKVLRQERCQSWASVILGMFQDVLPPSIHVDQEPTCISRENTVSAFLHTPVFVSVSGGSFGFLPGLARHPRRSFVFPSFCDSDRPCACNWCTQDEEALRHLIAWTSGRESDSVPLSAVRSRALKGGFEGLNQTMYRELAYAV